MSLSIGVAMAPPATAGSNTTRKITSVPESEPVAYPWYRSARAVLGAVTPDPRTAATARPPARIILARCLRRIGSPPRSCLPSRASGRCHGCDGDGQAASDLASMRTGDPERPGILATGGIVSPHSGRWCRSTNRRQRTRPSRDMKVNLSISFLQAKNQIAFFGSDGWRWNFGTRPEAVSRASVAVPVAAEPAAVVGTKGVIHRMPGTQPLLAITQALVSEVRMVRVGGPTEAVGRLPAPLDRRARWAEQRLVGAVRHGPVIRPRGCRRGRGLSRARRGRSPCSGNGSTAARRAWRTTRRRRR